MRNPTTHIDKVINAQSLKQVLQNRLKTSIGATKWLAKQLSAFQCHNESSIPLNHGNFFELIQLLRLMNKNIAKIVLECANDKYTSLMI